jgi:hypothetical protein
VAGRHRRRGGRPLGAQARRVKGRRTLPCCDASWSRSTGRR